MTPIQRNDHGYIVNADELSCAEVVVEKVFALAAIIRWSPGRLAGMNMRQRFAAASNRPTKRHESKNSRIASDTCSDRIRIVCPHHRSVKQFPLRHQSAFLPFTPSEKRSRVAAPVRADQSELSRRLPRHPRPAPRFGLARASICIRTGSQPRA